ncbi:MAG: hypothetical protein LC674_05285 [Actinobacteria bacterium]|nr:hypothetical protein [Actinomycetota bacterium]
MRDRAGPSHVAALPNLPDRRVLAFGRAIGCEDPLFLRVNDPDRIRAALFPPAVPQPEPLFAPAISRISSVDSPPGNGREEPDITPDEGDILLCWCPDEGDGHAPHGAIQHERWGWFDDETILEPDDYLPRDH